VVAPSQIRYLWGTLFIIKKKHNNKRNRDRISFLSYLLHPLSSERGRREKWRGEDRKRKKEEGSESWSYKF
jgi:hypothetical protein